MEGGGGGGSWGGGRGGGGGGWNEAKDQIIVGAKGNMVRESGKGFIW